MTNEYKYTTLLVKGPRNGVFAHFPYQSAKIFGTRKTVRVKATFEGKTYEMSLLPHGNGTHWLHVRKEIRQAIGKDEGDMVNICIVPDNSPQKIDIPDYLQWLLEDDPEMMKAFVEQTYSSKKFWVEFIEEPKSDEVKVNRINRMFTYLAENSSGKK